MKTHGRPRFMADGTIVYPKRGWEPPPIPAGYRRKSDNLRSADAWIMLPVLPDCQQRQIITKETPCGAVKITYRCVLFGDITVPRCLACDPYG